MKSVISFLKELGKTILISICIALILLKFFFFPIRVKGSSMHPTLQNEQLGISFIISRTLGIERFDIVIIEPQNGTDRLVKRVIGLPNDKITYRNNKLYVNDSYVEEPFLSEAYTEDLEIVLGDNEYFCLGDNRTRSRDSRYYGPFLQSELLATHALIYYPFTDIGFHH